MPFYALQYKNRKGAERHEVVVFANTHMEAHDRGEKYRPKGTVKEPVDINLCHGVPADFLSWTCGPGRPIGGKVGIRYLTEEQLFNELAVTVDDVGGIIRKLLDGEVISIHTSIHGNGPVKRVFVHIDRYDEPVALSR